MTPVKASIPEDTEENRAVCRQFCGNCPTYRAHNFGDYEPKELFCARGRTSCPDKNEVRCYCLGCELFLKYHMRLAYYCTKG
ncbi:MAG TPA: DUF2769 domain-containing protein [Methanoregula sp.]|nr:DUF2769 domain-containing protein [Methanoregula sp.]